MKIIESIPLDLVLAHLDRTHSAVRPPIDELFRRDDYTACRSTLDDSDLERLILYWEFKIHTKNGTCRVADTLPSSAEHDRIRSFIHGNPERGYLHDAAVAITIEKSDGSASAEPTDHPYSCDDDDDPDQEWAERQAPFFE